MEIHVGLLFPIKIRSLGARQTRHPVQPASVAGSSSHLGPGLAAGYRPKLWPADLFLDYGDICIKQPACRARNQRSVAATNRPASIGMLGAALLVLGLVSEVPTAGAGERMVRLCIASVDPAKLSSQCVMCNRREFPLTVIDCTGITKVNDLIANPLSVQEATCLIYNCRRQVPDVKPEPYHGSVSHAANYRVPGPPSGYPHGGSSATSSRNYQMLSMPGMFGPNLSGPSVGVGNGYPIPAIQPIDLSAPRQSPFMSRYGLGHASYLGTNGGGSASMYSSMAAPAPRGLIGGPNLLADRQRSPYTYALMPGPSFPFGSRKYKMALMPLYN